jgi:hypothetical protein
VRRDSYDRRVRIVKETHGAKELTRIIDLETGEIINEYWNSRTKSPLGRPAGSTGKGPHFYRVYCSNWADIIDKKRLSFIEIGVLMSLMRFVDWESNFLVHPVTGKNLNASELAKLLKTSDSHLPTYLDALHKKGLLSVVKCGGNGYPNHYILNSHILFKGNKMKDLNEHERFNKDCPYQPPATVKYRERAT